MPLYDFRCRTCDETFEVRRPMSESSDPAVCPQGHDDTVRLLASFASVGGAAEALRSAPGPKMRHSGGCCGGACH